MHNLRTSLALAAVLSPLLAVPAPSPAAETLANWAFDRAGACLGTVSGDSEHWDDGVRCVGDRIGGLLVDEAARWMTEQGRRTFGEHFRLVHRMSWSPLGQELAGELDAIIPLSFRGGVQAGADADVLRA